MPAFADYSDQEMHAALAVNIPNYAKSIVTTNEVVEPISSLEILGHAHVGAHPAQVSE